jgi:hypothetical protein
LQPLGGSQNRLRDFDVVIKREHVDYVRRCIGDRRQSRRQFAARLGLDGAHQAHHDVVEDADLFIRVAGCATDE